MPSALRGERAVLIGAQGAERITAEDLARRLDTINYEITCGLTPRVARAYHRDGARRACRSAAVSASAPSCEPTRSRRARAPRSRDGRHGSSGDRARPRCSGARRPTSTSSSAARPAKAPRARSPAPPGALRALRCRGVRRMAGRRAPGAAGRSTSSRCAADARGGPRAARLHRERGRRAAPGGELIDPLGGLEDLRVRRLRMAGAGAFAADPLRVLRLVRDGRRARPRARARGRSQRPRVRRRHCVRSPSSACSRSCAGSSPRAVRGEGSS